MARLLFSKSFVQQIRLHAQVGILPLQPAVLIFQGLRLGNHR